MKKSTKKNVSCLSDTSCKGHLQAKRISYKVHIGRKTVTVPDIEVLKCNLCHEHFFSYEASKKIDLYKKYSGRLMLRLDPQLHFKLVRISRKHRRSLNQEIHYLLERAAG